MTKASPRLIPERVARRLKANRPTKGTTPYYVVDANGCWIWLRRIDAHGYGQLTWMADGKTVTAKAHRVMYEIHVGPIPDGLMPDHTCEVTACCNYEHIEPVTHGENLWRSARFSGNRTHCPKGHLIDGRRSDGRRYCLTCNRIRVARYR